MFASLVSKIVSYVLSEYVESLTSSQMEAEFLSGMSHINDLKLKEVSFIVSNIPIKIVNGVIRRVELSIPWSLTFSKPSFCDIDEVLILAKVGETDNINFNEIIDSMNNIEIQELCFEHKISRGGIFRGFINKIINKLEVIVSKIHIRIEYEDSNQIVYAFGITAPILKLTSVDNIHSSSNTLIRKSIAIYDLSVYINTKTYKISLENFKYDMNMCLISDNKYIINKVSIDGVFEMVELANGKFNFLKLNINGFDINLSSDQWRIIIIFLHLSKMFKRKLYFFPNGRPYIENFDSFRAACGDWWLYLFKCANKKNKPLSFNVETALTILKNRNIIVPYLRNLKKYSKKVKYYQNKLGSDVIFSLAVFAYWLKNKEVEQELNSELGDDLNLRDIMDTHVQFQTKISIEVDDISLYQSIGDNPPFLSATFKGFNCDIYAENHGIELKGSVGNMFIIYMNGKRTFDILQFTEENHKACIDVDFKLYKNDIRCVSSIISPKLNHQIEFVHLLRDFYDGTEILFQETIERTKKSYRDSSLVDIQQLIQKHIFPSVTINIFNPSLVLNDDSNEMIINLEKVVYKSGQLKPYDVNDPSTFYDNFHLSICGFDAYFNAVKVTKPLDFDIDLSLLFIPMTSIPSTIFRIDIQEIQVKIKKELFNYLLNIHKKFTIKSIDTKKIIKQSEAIRKYSFEVLLCVKKFHIELVPDNRSKSTDITLDELDINAHSYLEYTKVMMNIGKLSLLDNITRSEALFDSDGMKPISAELIFGNKNIISLCFISSRVSFCTEYLRILKEFFIIEKNDKGNDQKNYIPDYDIRINMHDSHLILYLPSIDTQIPLEFKFGRINSSFANEKVGLTFVDCVISSNNEAMVTVPESLFQKEGLKSSLRIEDIFLNIRPYSFNLITEACVYLIEQIDVLLDIDKTKVSNNMLDGFINKVRTCLYQDTTLYTTLDLHSLRISSSNREVKIDVPTVEGYINEAKKLFIYRDGISIFYKSFTTTVDFQENANAVLYLTELNYLVHLLMQKSKNILLSYPKLNPKDVKLFINIPGLHLDILSDDNVVKYVVTSGKVFADCLIKQVSSATITLNSINSRSRIVDGFTEFIRIDEVLQLTVSKKSLFVAFSDLNVSYLHQHFEEFLRTATRIFTDPDRHKLQPPTYEHLDLKIDGEKFNIHLLSWESDSSLSGVYLKLDKLHGKNTGDILNVFGSNLCMITYSKEEMGHVDDFSACITFNTQHELPPLPQSVPDEIVSLFKKDVDYLISVIVDVQVDDLNTVYSYVSVKKLCDALLQFLAKKRSDLLYQPDIITNFTINRAVIKVPLFNILVNLQELLISTSIQNKSIQFNSIKVLCEENLILNSEENSFTLRVDSKKEAVLIASKINILLTPKVLNILMTLVCTSPFILTKWSQQNDDQNQSSFLLKLKNINFFIPVSSELMSLDQRCTSDFTYLVDLGLEFLLNNDELNMEFVFGRILTRVNNVFMKNILDNFKFLFRRTIQDGVCYITILLTKLDFDFSLEEIAGILILSNSLKSFVKMPRFNIHNKQKKYDTVTCRFIIDEILFHCSETKTKDTYHNPLFSASLPSINIKIDSGNETVFDIAIESLKFFNKATKFYDHIVESFTIQCRVSFERNHLTLSFDSSSIMINISKMVVDQLIYLFNLLINPRQYIQFPVRHRFIIKNELGAKQRFCFNGSEYVLNSMESLMFDDQSDPEFSLHLNDRKLTYRMSDLTYPFFINSQAIIVSYLDHSEKVILFTSLVKFCNNLKTPIVVIHRVKGKFKFINRIDCFTSCSLPQFITKIDKIALTNSPNYENSTHSTFTIDDLLQGSFVVPCKIGEKVISVRLSTSINNIGVLNVNIEYLGSIKNLLPDPLRIKLKNFVFDIDPGKTIMTELIQSDFAPLEMLVALNGADFPKEVSIVDLKNSRSVLHARIEDSTENIQLVVYVEHRNDNSCILYIFSQLIIYNITDIKLYCYSDNKARKFVRSDRVKKLYLSRSESLESEDVPFSLFIKKSNKCTELIDYNSKDRSKIIKVPLNNYAQYFLPISYTVKSSNIHTKVITLFMAFDVKNNLSERIKLNIGHGDRMYIKIDPGESKTIKVCPENLIFYFSFESYDNKIALQFSRPIHTTFIYRDSLIEFKIFELESCFSVTFCKGVLPQPLLICNNIQRKFSYYQKNYTREVDVLPGTTNILAFENPFDDCSIVVKIDNAETFEICTQMTGSLTLGSFYIQTLEYKPGYRAIYISNEFIHSEFCFDLNVSVQSMSVSFIDQLFGEQFVLYLDNIKFSSKFVNTLLNIELSIKDIELNDLHPFAPYSVVITSESKGDNSILEFSSQLTLFEAKISAIDVVCFRLSTLTALLDSSFVSDFIQTLLKLFPQKSTKFMDDFSPDVRGSVINRSQNLYIKNLNISPIMINITFEPSSGRSQLFTLASWYISLIPAINDGEIYISPLNLVDLIISMNEIRTCILYPYQKELIKQSLKLAFNTDILFNIGGLTSNIKNSLLNIPKRPVHAFTQLTIGSALAAGENVLSTASKFTHFVSDWEGSTRVTIGPNQTALTTICDGLGAVPESVSNALTGVVSAPIQGCQDGVYGFVKGVGKGVVGLIGKPVAGVFDAGTGIFRGLRKAINGSHIYSKRRKSRVLPSEHIIEYNEFLSEVQYDIQLHESLPTRIIYMFQAINGNSVYVTPRSMYVFTNYEFNSEYLMINIKSILLTDNVITIKYKKSNRKNSVKDVCFAFKEKEEARRVCMFLQSRTNFLINE